MSSVDKGFYIAVFLLPDDRRIKVGKLGTFVFPPGYYFYTGSAKKNLSARLKRHSLKKKPLRWHIDYLSVKAEMLGAVIIRNEDTTECKLAKKLDKLFDLAVADFGSSDCCCGGHLFYSEQIP